MVDSWVAPNALISHGEEFWHRAIDRLPVTIQKKQPVLMDPRNDPRNDQSPHSLMPSTAAQGLETQSTSSAAALEMMTGTPGCRATVVVRAVMLVGEPLSCSSRVVSCGALVAFNWQVPWPVASGQVQLAKS